MDDSVIMCDENIESYAKLSQKDDIDKKNFNEKKASCKTQSFYILLGFLLITIASLLVFTVI